MTASRSLLVLTVFLAISAMGVGIVSASLQQAVTESVDGCIIIMRAGTWNENVEINNDLTIIGGYGGGETIINGGAPSAGYGTEDGNGIDVYPVFTIEYADVVLTGLTITHGGIVPLLEYGSTTIEGNGISNIGGTLTLNDVTITGNAATYGGGINNDHGTVIMNSGTSITNNYAESVVGFGGGIYNNGGTVIMNSGSSITNNHAVSGAGGGIYNNGGTVTLNSGSSITNNYADFNVGGGIYNNGGTVTLNAGTISGNGGMFGGGGIYNFGGMVTLNPGSSITTNSAGLGTGGGIANDGGTYYPGIPEIYNYVYGNTPNDIVG